MNRLGIPKNFVEIVLKEMKSTNNEQGQSLPKPSFWTENLT